MRGAGRGCGGRGGGKGLQMAVFLKTTASGATACRRAASTKGLADGEAL